MEPADNPMEGKIVPKGGEPHPVLLLFAPFGDDRECVSAFRRFHSLRSFHPRLFTFAPFGDGRMLLAKDLLFCYFIAVFIKNGAIVAYLPVGREISGICFQCLISRLILYFECAVFYAWVCSGIIEPVIQIRSA